MNDITKKVTLDDSDLQEIDNILLEDDDLSEVDKILAKEESLNVSEVPTATQSSKPPRKPESLKEEAIGGATGLGIGYGAGVLSRDALNNKALDAIAADMGFAGDINEQFGQQTVRELAKRAVDEDIYGTFQTPEKQKQKIKSLLQQTGAKQAQLYNELVPEANLTPIEDIVSEFKKNAVPKTNIDPALGKAFENTTSNLEQFHKPGQTNRRVVKTGEEVSDLEKTLNRYNELKASKEAKLKALDRNVTFSEPSIDGKYLTGTMQEDIVTPEKITKGTVYPGKIIEETIPETVIKGTKTPEKIIKGKNVPEIKASDTLQQMINKELAKAEFLGQEVEVVPSKVINDQLVGGIKYKDKSGKDKIKTIVIPNKNSPAVSIPDEIIPAVDIPDEVIPAKTIPKVIIPEYTEPDTIIPARTKTTKTPLQVEVEGNKGARSLIAIIDSPQLIKQLSLEDLQLLKTQMTDLAYTEAGTPGSSRAADMASKAANVARNKIDERILELSAGGSRLEELKSINKKFGDLSKMEQGAIKEASKAAESADKVFSKEGLIAASKRGIFKGASKAGKTLPGVLGGLGALVGMTAGALAEEPGRRLKGAGYGLDQGLNPAESLGDAELPKSQMAREALNQEMRIKEEVRQMPVEEKGKVVDVLKSKLDYTPEEMQQVSEKILNIKGAESYATILNQAAQQSDRSRKSILWGLLQQPAFRELMKKVENE